MEQTTAGIVRRTWAQLGFLLMLMAFLLAPSGQGMAIDQMTEAKGIIDQAEETLKNFLSDPDMKWFSSHLQEAKGIYIVPKLTKGAFIFGVEGGNGVVLARDEKTGTWSEPVFYEISSASFGLQAGVKSQEAVLMIRTQKAVDSLLANKFKFGVDGSVAIGPKGMGADTSPTADFVTFTRAKGAFAGVSFEGASVRTRDELNATYYGEAVRPADIIISHKVKPNPHSKELHAMLGTANAKQ
jgi:lipid-binding SYLF domain-containing protein